METVIHSSGLLACEQGLAFGFLISPWFRAKPLHAALLTYLISSLAFFLVCVEHLLSYPGLTDLV